MLKQTAVVFHVHSLGEDGGGEGKNKCPNDIISHFSSFILHIPSNVLHVS